MQHAALVGKTKRITPPKLFFINDNVDNFRPDQLPGATRSKINNNLDNNNQQLATESTPSVAQGDESLWQIDGSPFAIATLTTRGEQSNRNTRQICRDNNNTGLLFIPVFIVYPYQAAAEGQYFAEGDEHWVMHLSQRWAEEARHQHRAPEDAQCHGGG